MILTITTAPRAFVQQGDSIYSRVICSPLGTPGHSGSGYIFVFGPIGDYDYGIVGKVNCNCGGVITFQGDRHLSIEFFDSG